MNAVARWYRYSIISEISGISSIYITYGATSKTLLKVYHRVCAKNCKAGYDLKFELDCFSFYFSYSCSRNFLPRKIFQPWERQIGGRNRVCATCLSDKLVELANGLLGQAVFSNFLEVDFQQFSRIWRWQKASIIKKYLLEQHITMPGVLCSLQCNETTICEGLVCEQQEDRVPNVSICGSAVSIIDL